MQRGLQEHINWMWLLTRGFRVKILFYVLLELLSVALGLVFVLWTKKVVDAAVAVNKPFFSTDLAVMLLALLLSILLRTLASCLSERVKVDMLVATQKRLLERQLCASWQFLNNWTSGDIQIRVQDDAKEVVQMAAQRIPTVAVTLFSLIGSFTVLAWMDARLALILLAVSLLFGCSKIYFKKTKELHQDLKKAQSEFGHVIQESIQLKLLIRALAIYPMRWKRVELSLGGIKKLEYALINFTTFSHGLVRLLGGIGFLLAFCWGLYRLHAGFITFGALTAFLQLVGRIQAPVLALMALAPLIVRARVAIDRLMDVTNMEVEPKEEDFTLNELTAIQVNQVGFKYGEELIIDNFMMRIEKGESIAIMGPSGRGKTTFIRMLLGLLKPTVGEIILETNQKNYTLKAAYRVNMAYVPQGGKLFRGTIWENLNVMKPEITAEDVEKAIFLGCAEFIYDLPDGLDTLVGQEGYGLSEGQAQRIAIVRAMIRDSPIWILDELTSALDKQTAKTVMTRLLNHASNKMVVIVTHDEDVANCCSKIIYI